MIDVLLSAVFMTAAVLVVTQFARLVRTKVEHNTIREAISRDNQSVSQMLSAIEEKPQPTGQNDDRTAMILIALGLAMVGMGLVQGDQDDIRNFVGAGLFPGLVGIALLIRYYLVQRRGA
ncbi:MAG: hypothetical protein V4659_07175 [Pseudomonadota bacterium]